jgi:hypothetical protein
VYLTPFNGGILMKYVRTVLVACALSSIAVGCKDKADEPENDESVGEEVEEAADEAADDVEGATEEAGDEIEDATD